MAFFLPLIAGAVGGLGLAGGGVDLFSGVEIATKKEQTTQSFQETYNISPTINRTYDIQTNTASGGSTITTKKEQAITQQPSTEVSPSIIPMQTQGAGADTSNPIGSSASGSGFDITQILLIGGAGLGVYYLFFKKDKGDKKNE